MAEVREIKAKITGKVQMVMYRDFVQRKARGLWLAGTVANVRDGSVEVIAQGEEEQLLKLVDDLHKGPFLAKVLTVSVEWRKPKKKYEGFSLIH